VVKANFKGVETIKIFGSLVFNERTNQYKAKTKKKLRQRK